MKDFWLPSGTGKIRILPTPTHTNRFHWIIDKSGRRREKIKKLYGDITIHTQ